MSPFGVNLNPMSRAHQGFVLSELFFAYKDYSRILSRVGARIRSGTKVTSLFSAPADLQDPCKPSGQPSPATAYDCLGKKLQEIAGQKSWPGTQIPTRPTLPGVPSSKGYWLLLTKAAQQEAESLQFNAVGDGETIEFHWEANAKRFVRTK